MTSNSNTSVSNNWLLPEKFKLQIKMLSDWHVGSGYGRPGNIDRLVAKDKDNLPYIPAKTIVGIWRDACEQLAYALDNNNSNQTYWLQLVDFVFGSQPSIEDSFDTVPHPAQLSINPAHLSPLLRQHFCGLSNNAMLLRSGLIFIKPGNSIDSNSGVTKQDYLRFEEVARGQMILETECSLLNYKNISKDKEISEKTLQFISALLLAGARLLERMGGKRRRGAGKCEFIIRPQMQSNSDIDWLEKNYLSLTKEQFDLISNSFLQNNTNTYKLVSQPATSRDNKEWFSLPIKLKLKTPVAISVRTIGNVSETLDFIPGTYLLPYLSQILNELGYKDYFADFITGKIQILPATLEVAGKRGKPVPMVLFRRKEAGGFNFSKTVVNRIKEDDPKENGKSIQTKGYREGYIDDYLPNKNLLPNYKTTEKIIFTHNTIKDDVQRPTSEVGGVYSREAIASNNLLYSEIHFHNSVKNKLDKLNPNWQKALTKEYRIGVSQKDDYGLVEISPIENIKVFNSNAKLEQNKLTIWLLSDLLLRNKALRPSTSIDDLMQVLSDSLNVKLKRIESETLLSEMVRTRRIESWQKQWGLPRPTLIAMVAGSCVQFEIDEILDENKQKELKANLQKIEAEGIGERRAEGYGQVCFNADILLKELSKYQAQHQEKENIQHQQLALLPNQDEYTEIYEFAQIVEKAVWRNLLADKTLAIASDKKWREKNLGFEEGKPTQTQLGAFRNVLQKLKGFNDKEIVLRWLDHLEKTPNRKDKWPENSLKEIKKIIRGITKDEKQNINYIWDFIEWNKDIPVLTKDGRSRLKQELWAEAVKALFDASIRAHKRGNE